MGAIVRPSLNASKYSTRETLYKKRETAKTIKKRRKKKKKKKKRKHLHGETVAFHLNSTKIHGARHTELNRATERKIFFLDAR